MNIAIGSDHRGVTAKGQLISQLRSNGHQVTDLGTDSEKSTDYPQHAGPCARLVSEGRVDRGILMCGTGIGCSIVANKFRAVRAAVCHDELTAEMSRRHNDANVLCLGADLLGNEMMRRIVELWLATEFEGGRHARRIDKITAMETAHLQYENLRCRNGT